MYRMGTEYHRFREYATSVNELVYSQDSDIMMMFRRGRASLRTPDTIRRDLPGVRFLYGAVKAWYFLKGKSSCSNRR